MLFTGANLDAQLYMQLIRKVQKGIRKVQKGCVWGLGWAKVNVGGRVGNSSRS
jgi:hypothetical protein